MNGENAAGGRGISPRITIDLLRAGVSVITTGDHIWDQRDLAPFIDTEPRLLRPLNYPEGAPGSDNRVRTGNRKGKVGVINAQAGLSCSRFSKIPFRRLTLRSRACGRKRRTSWWTFMAKQPARKLRWGRFLDGKVSAVIGTHTHVQTADEQIFPGGTAFMCDAGMCGPIHSILGRTIEPIMNRFVSNLPAAFPVAGGEVRLRGALLEIDKRLGAPLVLPGSTNQAVQR